MTKKSSGIYKLAAALFGLVSVLLGGYVVYTTYSSTVVPGTTPAPVVISTWQSQLDGTVVTSTAAIVPTVLGVMIDNHPDVRTTQAGLSLARVVYEAFAEGGITRYLAIFNAADQVARVGPVRSARPYYVDWLREYGDSSYWHCGGSPQALTEIKQLGLFDVNQFFNDPEFWRDKQFDAPHNLFTNTDHWSVFLDKKSSAHPAVAWQGWLFESAGAASSSARLSDTVTIHFTKDYKVTWDYQAAGDTYERSINGSHHLIAGLPIMASTIVIEEVPTSIIDDEGRKDMDTVGTGSVRVLKHGTMIRGTWKKAVPTDRTRFYDEGGVEIPLAPGQIWVEVVPTGTVVDVTT